MMIRNRQYPPEVLPAIFCLYIIRLLSDFIDLLIHFGDIFLLPAYLQISHYTHSAILIISLLFMYSAVIVPPMRSTSVRAMDSPNPVEWCAASTV
ncbi:hypothetical protein SAMN02910406_00106 [Ruminococcus albus]|uniref:Uncharacterized protein n=1 Tax=Ruminococcus albus TaxID=1264 RepID=A0A1I1CX19_RUMAL|nr:hypothetical protein SAMN02910406_00106 [Ruminococcus albus]